MCYNDSTLNQISPNLCSQCGSPLILVSQVTEKVEGSRFPQTTTEYRCSNQECQDEKDKQTSKRMKLQETKVLAEEKRAEEKLRQKKNIMAIATEHIDE